MALHLDWCDMQFPLQIITQLNIYDINGNLIIQIGPEPAMFFYNSVAPTELVLSISAFSGTDVYGNPYLSGFTSYGNVIDKTITSIDGADIIFSSRPPALAFDTNGYISVQVNPDTSNTLRPQLDIVAPEANTSPGGAGFIRMQSYSRNGVFLPRVTLGVLGGDTAGVRIAARGTIVQERVVGFTITQMDWENLPLAVGWTAGAIVPQCYVDAMGFTHLEGAPFRAAGTPPAGEVLGTLTASFRPRRAVLCGIVFDSSATPGRIVIRTNGNIEIYDAPNNSPVINNVTFSTSQTV